MIIPPDWKNNLIDAYIETKTYQYGGHHDRIIITLKGRYVVKKWFGTDEIGEKELYHTEVYTKKDILADVLQETAEWKRVDVLLKALMEMRNEKITGNWRKRATDALVSSNMTEKDKFISDWLEEFKNK